MFASQPDLVWRLQNGRVEIAQTDTNTGQMSDFAPCPIAANQPDEAGVVASVNAAIADADMVLPDNTPPMCAGLYGYFGYECVRLAEPRVPDSNRDVLGVPDSVLFRPQLVAVLDNLKGLLSLYVVVRPQQGVDAKQAYAAGVDRLQRAVDDLSSSVGFDNQPSTLQGLPDPVSNMTPEAS